MKAGRILVVDDEPLLRELLRHVLVEDGYVVDVAPDGETALAMVPAFAPDIILLDLMMPGMNGKQFMQRLRADAANVHIPVLLITAVHGLHADLAALGVTEVLEKPFDSEFLLARVALAMYRSDGDWAEVERHGKLDRTGPQAPESDVIVLVDPDRDGMRQVEHALTERGFNVVSMTRPLVELARLMRALAPRAVVISQHSVYVDALLASLPESAAQTDPQVVVYSRDEQGAVLACRGGAAVAYCQCREHGNLVACIEQATRPRRAAGDAAGP